MAQLDILVPRPGAMPSSVGRNFMVVGTSSVGLLKGELTDASGEVHVIRQPQIRPGQRVPRPRRWAILCRKVMADPGSSPTLVVTLTFKNKTLKAVLNLRITDQRIDAPSIFNPSSPQPSSVSQHFLVEGLRDASHPIEDVELRDSNGNPVHDPDFLYDDPEENYWCVEFTEVVRNPYTIYVLAEGGGNVSHAISVT